MNCAICSEPRVLTKCVDCARRVCFECYTTDHNLCAACAERRGIHVRMGPRMWTVY